ncbi:hypothetical protein NE357_28305 [Pseudomonas sp. G7(2022)]|nr:hypothetical protein [Pseudomonas fluorescens]
MKGFSIVLGSLLSAATSIAFAADPDFKDYTVTPVFSGPNHEPVQQEQSNPGEGPARQGQLRRPLHPVQVRLWRRRHLRRSAGHPAGDVVGGLPNAYDGSTFDTTYLPDSRLIIISGVTLDGEEDAQGNHLENRNRDRYYEFVNNEFRLLGMTDLESPSIDEE